MGRFKKLLYYKQLDMLPSNYETPAFYEMAGVIRKNENPLYIFPNDSINYLGIL